MVSPRRGFAGDEAEGGGSVLGFRSGERPKKMRGKEGYGALGSEVRANWGSLVLQRARHGGVGVAAARSFGGGVAKGGEVQREGRGRRGAGARRVDASAKQRRSWSWPRATQRGGGRRGAVGGEREQRGKLGKKTGT